MQDELKNKMEELLREFANNKLDIGFPYFLIQKIIDLENKIEHLEYGGDNI